MDKIKYFIGICGTGGRYDDDTDDESGPLEIVAHLITLKSQDEEDEHETS